MKLLCLLTLAAVLGGEPDFEKCVLALSGASAIEELDEDELERYRHYAAHPLCLNLSSRSRLLSSGLLTSYRVATLLDYRQHYGDVLSLTELAAVDAYGPAFVEALSPFISLESSSLPGQRMSDGHHLSHDAVLRSSARGVHDVGGREWNWSSAAKYDICLDRRWEAGLSGKAGGLLRLKTSSGDGNWTSGKTDLAGSFHLSYDGGRHLSRVVVGAYNCRFGQGLAFWSGFSLSSTIKSSSASRNPTMLSAYRGYDYSSSLRGVAAEFSFPCGRLSSLELTSFVSHPGLAGANLSWFSRHGQVGATFYMSCIASGRNVKTGLPSSNSQAVAGSSEGRALRVDASKVSIDARWNIRGIDIFSEVATDLMNRSVAVLAGVRRSAGNFKPAFVLMYYPQNYDASFTGALRTFSKCVDTHASVLMADWISDKRRHSGSISVNCSYKPSVHRGATSHLVGLQSKADLLWNWQILECLTLETKASWRWRDYEADAHRAELRNDLRYKTERWNAAFRSDVLWSHSLAGLICADLGYDFPRLLRLWSRAGTFHIDNWSDRIYCYERDVPGMFNVPAMYGRGFWCSALAGLRLPHGLKLYLRTAVTYKKMAGESVTRAEFRFQLNYSI